MVAGRSFQVHHNGSDFEVNYLSDSGLQGFKAELFLLTHIPPDEQKIMGADEDRIISCESDLLAVISGQLRLVSASANDGLLSSDEEEAGMLQGRDYQPDNRGLKGKGLAHLTPTVTEGLLTLSNSQHSADQFQPLELEKYRLVNQPSCDGSGNDTMGHGMRVATPSEILHGRYEDKIHGKITNLLRKCLLLEGPGVEHIKELELFQQDRRRYIYSLISICFCDNLDNEISDIAGLCLKNELKDADGLVDPCLMDFIKTKLVAIISSPRDCVPRSACQVISELAGVAGKKLEEWPELIELIECSLHNEQLLTPAALETFGYVSVQGLALWRTTGGKIQEVLARGMNLKNNDCVRLAATKAMCYTLSNVVPHHVCKMGIILEAILEAAGSSNLNIKQAAFECLIVLPSRFHMKLAICPSYLKKIMEFTAVAVKEGKKDDAFQAIQFWNYLFEAQINMLKTKCGAGSFNLYSFIMRNLEDLIPLLLSLSDMEEIEKVSEFDRRTLRLCLGNLAIVVGEHPTSFANAVELFIDANSTARHKYMAKVIYSIMGAVVSDIFGEEEEAGKEGKVANEMERGEGSQKPEIPEKKKELGLWKGLLLARMTGIFEALLKQDCGFLCKTVTETISTYPHHHLISNPAELMRGVCKNYFESAFSYLREPHGENLLGTFHKSWGTHLCMIQLLKLFFSVCGCHSKYLETWVLLLAFPKITDTVTELIDLASNGDRQMDKKLVESVTQILMDHGLGEAYKNNINGASRCAESIAMYCETLLKKDFSDEEMEKQLDTVSVVSKFYFGIDHFTGFYIKRVCRRIHDVDWSKESRMLTMVRGTLFGGEEKYSSPLKNMEHTVNFIVSGQNEDKQKFGEYLVNNAIIHGGMVMNLATAPHRWSFKDASFKNIKLPQEFANMVGVMTKFFQNTPRPLQYTPEQIRPRKFVQINYPLSSCTVECMFGTERIEMDISVTQATLLKLFDTADTWIFWEILTELRISHEELVSLIHSLSQENNKLLIKVPSTENILPTDRFELNTNFTYTSPIPRPVLEDSRRRNVVERVDNDMINCIIRCVLMKIMKPSKGLRPMDREKLAGAAIEKCAGLEKCGFVPTRAAVDVSIASLTKDEYLLVDKNDNNKLWWNEE